MSGDVSSCSLAARVAGAAVLVLCLACLLVTLAAPAADHSARAAASSSAGPLPAERGRWSWPVEGPLLSTFRYGRDPFARGQRRGIRIGAPVGSTVRSACAGRVRFSGTAATSGRVVSVACGRLTATYLHLAALSVRGGEEVRRGQRLGAVGRSGRTRLRTPHLAFGARLIGSRWGYVDPLDLLPSLPGSQPPAPLPPAGRNLRRLPPALGPSPVPEPLPSLLPLDAPARARAPRPVPREVDGLRLPHSGRPVTGGEEPALSTPLAVWIGLAVLTGALAAWPVGRRRRRRGQSKRIAGTEARIRGA